MLGQLVTVEIEASTGVGKKLRDGGAREEALHLARQLTRWLQELVRDAPEDHYLFAELSKSWEQVGKAHWELNQVEETLDAYRHALAAQQRACTLAPNEGEYRRVL